jgi:predicted CoA-binding protein
MFDNEIVPKYIIGKDYKIIPVNPATTDSIVNTVADACAIVNIS